MYPKVSVVVPIYKVEKYIHRCVDSILEQTYKNLEIILVNDGSPDRCGEIAERYKAKDHRIKVIHKENGGLSDARNQGMKHASGEYTTFVDSDDWLEKNMIDYMVTCSQKYEADVVQSAFYYAYEDKLLLDNRHTTANEAPIIMNNKQVMQELVVNEKVKNFAWGKLYKTELIRDIEFKKGVLFEDIYWAHQVMKRVNTFLLTCRPLYNYFQRSDSIVSNYSIRNLDMIEGLRERHLFIEEYYSELIDESYKAILKAIFIHYTLLVLKRKLDKEGTYKNEIKAYVYNNRHHLKKAVHRDKPLARQLNLFLLSPYLNIAYLGLKKTLRKFSILSKPEGLTRIEQ